MSGNNKRLGRGATTAAHAASKKKSNAVNLTANTEANLRTALEGLDIAEPSQAGGQGSADAEEIAGIYTRLLAHGFQEAHVKEGLQAIAGRGITEDSALDWLCLHVDPADLPWRFKGNAVSRAAGSKVEVLAKADRAAKPRKHEEVVIPGMRKAPAPDLASQKQAAKEQKEDEARKRQEWILKYAEQSDSSEDGSEEGGGRAIEDWEIWGDPREIERRKADRKRANLPLEQRRLQLAEEWLRSKAEAATAKAAANKPRQKAAGMVIRNLKMEMKELGLSEEDAELLAPAPTPTPAANLPSSSGKADAAWEEDSDFPDLAGSGTSRKAESNGTPPAAPLPPPADAVAGRMPPGNGRSGAEPPVEEGRWEELGETPVASGEAGDEEFMMMALFDDDAAEPADGQGLQPLTKPIASTIAPWGTDNHRRKKKGLMAAPTKPAAEIKAPKAVLQQICHKEGRAPPRFEKLPLGGDRLKKAGFRYSVELESLQQKGGRKKQRGHMTYSLKEADDGWETISEAQNAAATLAIFEVATDRSVCESLPPVFQELWQQWEGQGGGAPEVDATSTTERAEFAALLASQARIRNGSRKSKAEASGADQCRQPGGKGGARVLQNSRAASEESCRLQRRLEDFKLSSAGKKWAQHRQNLPVWGIRQGILDNLADEDVLVVGGDTGCGKTTQVPQYLLDAGIEAGSGASTSIICTQPRRIAAISVAERVCQEREDTPPGTPGSSVGYHVRLDAASTRDTKLLFCTTGILLRRMSSDPTLPSISHVVVDEVHERTLQGDFLMALLKDIVLLRRAQGNPLKVVLMSATLDSNLFASYFGGCPTLAAGGRTFPVDQVFLEDVYEMIGYRLDPEGPCALRNGTDSAKRKALEKSTGSCQGLVKGGWGDDEADAGALNKHYDAELYTTYSPATRKNLARLNENRIDYDLLDELVCHLANNSEEGAILVFMPGMGEINRLCDQLTAHAAYREGRQWVIPLHSSVSPQEQRKAFEVPPPGIRKVVIATNIAETSLTISDVSLVVDSGKLKERRYDASRGMSLLVEDWVSRANAMQRKGRAGRVRAGKCLGLYTRNRFDHRMRAFQAPEMVRVPLEELVLQIHLLGMGPAATFLEKVIQPPPARSIQTAVAHLQALKALSQDECLTPLGHHLAQLPVDARVGKLLLLACSLGCLAPALTIAACLSYKSPFSTSADQQEAAQRMKLSLASPGASERTIASGQQSDHLLMAAVFQAWSLAFAKGGRREAAAYARKNLVSQATLEMVADMRWQFASMLADARFVLPPRGYSGAGSRDKSWTDDSRQPWNKQAHQPSMVKGVLCAALYPHVAVMDDSAGIASRPGWHDGTSPIFIHPSSVNHMLGAHQFLRPYLVFLEKMRTSQTFLMDCTVVSPMALLIFGGELEVRHEEGHVLIDNWIRVRVAAPTAVLVKKLRLAIDGLLQQKIGRPELDISASGDAIIDALVKLLSDDESSQTWDK